eukprot:scpid48176/ scgid3850/ 
MVLSFSARVQVKKEARARLNTRMRSAACTFKKKRKAHKKGRDKYHQSNVYTCSVDLKDMATAIDLRKEVELLKEELVVVQEEMKSIHYKHDEVVTLYNAMTTLTGTVDDGTLLDQLGRDNQELRQYISAYFNTPPVARTMDEGSIWQLSGHGVMMLPGKWYH